MSTMSTNTTCCLKVKINLPSSMLVNAKDTMNTTYCTRHSMDANIYQILTQLPAKTRKNAVKDLTVAKNIGKEYSLMLNMADKTALDLAQVKQRGILDHLKNKNARISLELVCKRKPVSNIGVEDAP